jgi:hypothetical protein
MTPATGSTVINSLHSLHPPWMKPRTGGANQKLEITKARSQIVKLPLGPHG